MSFDQGEFNFDARHGEDGYRRWREELEARKRAFEARYGVILGKKVRLQLRDFARPIEGTIHLAETGRPGKREPRLKVGHHEFTPADIESMVRIAGPGAPTP